MYVDVLFTTSSKVCITSCIIFASVMYFGYMTTIYPLQELFSVCAETSLNKYSISHGSVSFYTGHSEQQNKMIFFLCIFVLNFLVPQVSSDLALEHTFFASLDEDENVKMYWNVSLTKKEIYFAVEAKTTGWIGFGISSGQGKMKGADIVIGWVKDGKPYFKVSKYRF